MAYAGGLMGQGALISTENANFYANDILRLEAPDALDGECPVLLIIFRGFGNSNSDHFSQPFDSEAARSECRAEIKEAMDAASRPPEPAFMHRMS